MAKGLTALFAALLERRVNLVSLRDSIDQNTAAGRLMANVLASVALVNRLGEPELADALYELGDETDARRIAELIVRRRRVSPITTTDALAAIVCEARDFTPARAAGAKLHPAARTL